MSKQEEAQIPNDPDHRAYLLELDTNPTRFLNHYPNRPGFLDNFGQLMNCSKKHPNVSGKAIIKQNGDADILFYALEDIPQGAQLRWYYGEKYKLPSNCVSDCEKCAKGK